MRMEHWLYSLPLRFRSLFRGRRVEQDLDDELQYHLERNTEEYIARGLTPEQARWAALRAPGFRCPIAINTQRFRRGSSPPLCIRQLPAIRWYWPAWF